MPVGPDKLVLLSGRSGARHTCSAETGAPFPVFGCGCRSSRIVRARRVAACIAGAVQIHGAHLTPTRPVIPWLRVTCVGTQ